MKNYIIIGAVGVLAILGFMLFGTQRTQAPTETATTTTTETATPEQKTGTVSKPITTAPTTTERPSPSTKVTYNDQGFTPKNIQVNVGDTVRFENKSSGTMWVAIDPHPSHTGYDGTAKSAHCPDGSSFDECVAVGNGEVYSFTFTKAGLFKYHNHVQASAGGTVEVK